MRARCTRWSVLCALLALVSSLVAVASPAAAYGANISITGHGWGHGRGGGQYGSLGYAVDHGWSYSQILDHYYGGTTKSVRGESLMTVNLTEQEDRDLIMTSGSGFQVDTGDGSDALLASGGEAVLVRRTTTGWEIFKAASCSGGSGGWGSPAKKYASSATPRVGTGYNGDDSNLMMKVCGPTGNVRSYRGIVTAFSDGTASGMWAVNSLPMESYLRGVVPRESPSFWGGAGGGKGMEALKYQAVAARSYAMAEQRTLIWKAYDTTQSQVYGGAALNGQSNEPSNTNDAISATAGEVRQHSNGSVARTEFSSSTGGWSAGGTFPAVIDEGDDVCISASMCNPNHNWTTSVATSAAQAAYPTVGTLQAITVTARNGLGADGGRVTSVKVTGSSGSVTTTGAGMQSKLGLKMDWFSIADVSVTVSRVSGASRLATAVAVSKDLYPTAGTAKAIVLASSTSYADALVGAPLALQKDGPILLTNSDALAAETQAEIQRSMGSSGTVYLLGGSVAVSDAVQSQLTGLGYTVQRLSGPTRAATAVEVAKALGNPTTIFEATGADFADALAAGAAAAKKGGAVLLTNGSTQAPETAAYFQGKTLTRYAVGGAAAAADPGATKSFVGVDRYDTAVRLALEFYAYPTSAGLASGTGFADALSGGVHAVRAGGPIVLTAPDRLTTRTKQYLQSAAESSLVKLTVYGGTGAVSDQAAADVNVK
jgi:SpoIID/LytB domain protein